MKLDKAKKLLYRLYKRLTLVKVIFWDHAMKKNTFSVWAENVVVALAEGMGFKYVAEEYREKDSKRPSIHCLNLGSIKL